MFRLHWVCLYGGFKEAQYRVLLLLAYMGLFRPCTGRCVDVFISLVLFGYLVRSRGGFLRPTLLVLSWCFLLGGVGGDIKASKPKLLSFAKMITNLFCVTLAEAL